MKHFNSFLYSRAKSIPKPANSNLSSTLYISLPYRGYKPKIMPRERLKQKCDSVKQGYYFLSWWCGWLQLILLFNATTTTITTHGAAAYNLAIKCLCVWQPEGCFYSVIIPITNNPLITLHTTVLRLMVGVQWLKNSWHRHVCIWIYNTKSENLSNTR